MKQFLFALLVSFALMAPAFAMEQPALPEPQEKQKVVKKKHFAQEYQAHKRDPIEGLPPVALVEVNKGERRLNLVDAEKNIIRSYQISLGKAPVGHKEQEGDNKTPEGKYTIDSKNGKSDYYRSLHISYPNKQDIARAKKKAVSPGGAIFIHGKPDLKFWMFWKYNKLNDWTNGCIAVNDKDMMELWTLITPGTPIIINP